MKTVKNLQTQLKTDLKLNKSIPSSELKTYLAEIGLNVAGLIDNLSDEKYQQAYNYITKKYIQLSIVTPQDDEEMSLAFDDSVGEVEEMEPQEILEPKKIDDELLQPLPTSESFDQPASKGELANQQPNNGAVAAYQTKTEQLLTQLVEETYGEDAKTEADFLIQTIATEAERETAILAAFPLIKDKFISHFWDTKYKAVYEVNKTKAQQGRESLTKFFRDRKTATENTAKQFGVDLSSFGIPG
jgi:hypothetical protein